MIPSLTSTKVYNLLKLIPRGRVTTYKANAQACNSGITVHEKKTVGFNKLLFIFD